jgi:hypothetical protein
MTTKLKPKDNVVKLSAGWIDQLLGQVIKTRDGREWVISGYSDEQLWFTPVSLGQQYMKEGIYH